MLQGQNRAQFPLPVFSPQEHGPSRSVSNRSPGGAAAPHSRAPREGRSWGSRELVTRASSLGAGSRDEARKQLLGCWGLMARPPRWVGLGWAVLRRESQQERSRSRSRNPSGESARTGCDWRPVTAFLSTGVAFLRGAADAGDQAPTGCPRSRASAEVPCGHPSWDEANWRLPCLSRYLPWPPRSIWQMWKLRPEMGKTTQKTSQGF